VLPEAVQEVWQLRKCNLIITENPSGKGDLSRPAGWDALTDGLFGPSIKGAGSKWDVTLFSQNDLDGARPSKRNIPFTPSNRISMMPLASMTAVYNCWAGEGSDMLGLYQQRFEAPGAAADPGVPVTTIKSFASVAWAAAGLQ
jgi:hypothetical protein